MKIIRNMDDWDAMVPLLAENGYILSQWQYGTDRPEGFHAWFFRGGKPQIEIVTHSNAVYETVMKYRV